MTNALCILFIVTAAWAVVGVHLFHDKSQEYFGNFEAALFSMFQVVSGDSWASAITRSIFKVLLLLFRLLLTLLLLGVSGDSWASAIT